MRSFRDMYTIVMFDIETKNNQKEITKFKKLLQILGFDMFQYSIYYKHSTTKEIALSLEQSLIKDLPHLGKIAILSITSAQFCRMKIFYDKEKEVVSPQPLNQNFLII